MLKACIFDLDGVLTDTAEFHFQAWKKMAEEVNYDLTLEKNELLKGVSRGASLDLILEWAGADPRMDLSIKNRLMDQKNKHYLGLVNTLSPTDLFPGVMDFFKEIKNQGLKIGLGSSSKNAVFILKKLGILEWFDAISDGNNFVHGKPDQAVFIAAANMLQEEPADCLVFEDAQAGVDAAIAAGMKCIGVGNPDNLIGAVEHIPGLQKADLKRYLALYL
jgi:beta-phosphoglucomutase